MLHIAFLSHVYGSRIKLPLSTHAMEIIPAKYETFSTFCTSLSSAPTCTDQRALKSLDRPLNSR